MSAKKKITLAEKPLTAIERIDAVGLDAVCAAIGDGKTLTGIAGEIGVSIGTLSTWIDADNERSARTREARVRTARLWDEKAEKGIDDAKDPFELSKAKELAHHYRWRAAKIAPKDYGDRQAIDVTDHTPKTPEQVNTRIAELLALAQTKPADGS